MSRNSQDTCTDQSWPIDRAPAAGKKTALDIDRIVGRRVRSLRLGRGLAQHQLAKELGISFQQLQKYESGANRISASKLWIISQVLSVDIADLFGDMPSNISAGTEIDADALEAAVVLSSVTDPLVRDSLMELIRKCADNR